MPIRYLLCLLFSLAPALALPQTGTTAPSPASVAFYYGAQAPWDELKAFDLVVVDPDSLPAGPLPQLGRTRLAAYVALGEVQPSRAYAQRLPAAWLRGENTDWGSRLIDQTPAEWPAFFAEQVIEPLWQRGLRTFFVDTLDSYHRFARTPQERAAQEAGMVAVIRELGRRYPAIRLVYNRGFEILPQTREWVDAVAAESLFQRYEAADKRYGVVPEGDRAWLLARLQEVRDNYRLPVIAIDYVPASDRALARTTARRIQDLGFIPWVATPELDTLGVSSIEVMPRRVLVVHSPVASEYEQREIGPVLFGSMPLQYLGYVPEFVDIRHLPEVPLAGRYAGVVVWLQANPDAVEREKLLGWLGRQAGDAVPLALVNQVEFLLGTPLARTLGLNSGAIPRTTAPIGIEQQDGIMGFETRLRPPVDGFFPLELTGGRPLLTLRRGEARQVAAGLAPWGGYVLDPYVITTLPGEDSGNRWVVNPFEFLRLSLKLPEMPVPDPTTESGRRMLLVHMDGDGFVSRSELPGNRLAGEELRDRVVQRYPVPMTVSVIEAELSPEGLHPTLSAQAEKTAQAIFRAPHVAIASHSYSHPFYWQQAGQPAAGGEDESYHLKVPGYQFSLQREIAGSVGYIESRLAPPGKKVVMFLWTGDCIPGNDAVDLTLDAGLLNMNGGDTIATRAHPTLTRVEGLGVRRGRGYQVFAPNQNENVYTNNWLGPYYGYERVIETFELTGTPRRLKPINIYFHTYLLTKRAGMQSFDKVMAYALRQDITPVHAGDYARKVLDFQGYVVARTPTGWRVRGDGALRTLRLPAQLGLPDLTRSQAVAGYRAGPDGLYVHLADGAAELVLTTERKAPVPRLESANARISAYETQAGRQRWTLEGEVPLEFSLADAGACRVSVAGRELRPVRRQADTLHYALNSHAARPLETICQR